MKQIFLLLPGILFFNLISAAQEYNTPVEYMAVISKQQENISKKYMSYASASAHGKNAKKVESLRLKLIDEVQEARMNIAGLPAFKGDKALRDTSVGFMKLYFNILNEDYSKIINMEEIAEQSYDAMEAYMMAQEMVEQKLEEGNEKMKLASEKFAARNNVTLIENKSGLDVLMKQFHEVNSYHKGIYLIFFKPYKQEAYMMEAVEKNNITGIEQNRNSLLKYAKEGLEKLAVEKPFQGDNSLLNSCKAVLSFYIMEAGEKMNTVSDYYLTKERFESIKKEYEKKSIHSKDDVNAFNKSVQDINAASQAYNSTNQTLNKQRDEVLNEWNRSVNTFFDKHTPEYN